MESNNKILLINPTHKQLAKIRKKNPDARLICFSDYEIGLSDNKNCDEWHLLYSYLPKNFETYLVNLSNQLIKKLIENKALKDLFRYYQFDFLHNSRFHLVHKVFYPILKRITIFHNIISNEKNIKFVFADKEYYSTATLFTENVKRLFQFKQQAKLKIAFLPLAAILYKFFLLPLLARLFYSKQRLNFKKKTILIGHIHEFNHFKSELGKSLFSEKTNFVILHTMRKFLLFKKQKIMYPHYYSFCPLDYFYSLKDFLSILPKYIQIVFQLPGKLKKNVSIDLFGRKIQEKFYSELLIFYYYFYLVSLKFFIISRKLTEIIEPNSTIVFSYASPFYINTMNNVFKKAGFITITYNHGLIQTPNQLQSETLINYSVSRFDLNLLKKFSHDKEFTHIQPHANFQGINNEFKRNIKILILSKVFYTKAPYNITLDFLKKCYDSLKNANIVYSSLAVKPHPMEPFKLLKKNLSLINENIEILDRNLDEVLKEYNFILTPISTTILDCLGLGKPFMIYKSNFESNETFISQIPEEITFCNKFEFSEKYDNLLKKSTLDLNNIYEKIFNAYYYDPCSK